MRQRRAALPRRARKKRVLTVHEVGHDGALALARERAYVFERARARVWRAGERVGAVMLQVGDAAAAAIDVRVGDTLLLAGRAARATSASRSRRSRHEARRNRVHASCRARPPGGRTPCCSTTAASTVLVQRTTQRRGDFMPAACSEPSQDAVKLPSARRGSTCRTPARRCRPDRRRRSALPFIAERADAGRPVVRPQAEDRPPAPRGARQAREAPSIGVVLKIETRAGFETLPRLLLEGLRRPPLGVMIARGDLQVEVGFERLAELRKR